jgi:hypothetical protein
MTLSMIPVLPVALSIIRAYEDYAQCVVKDAVLQTCVRMAIG